MSNDPTKDLSVKAQDLKSNENLKLESANNWSMYINSVKLDEDFGGVLEHVFKFKKDIYFVAVTWDYSKDSVPMVYPAVTTSASDLFFHIKPGGHGAEFIGDGLQIWPSQKVNVSLNTVILVFSSHASERAIGEISSSVTKGIKSTDIESVIGKIAGGIEQPIASLISTVTTKLVGLITAALEVSGDKHLATFEGSFGVESSQKDTTQNLTQNGVELGLMLNVS